MIDATFPKPNNTSVKGIIPARGIRHKAVSNYPCRQQTAAADLRQTNDHRFSCQI